MPDGTARLTARRELLGQSERRAEMSLDQVDAPHRVDDLMDPPAAHAGVDLDDARPLGRALALDVQHAAREPEGLDRLHAELHEAADRLRAIVRRAVKTGFLKRRLCRRRLLGDAGEDALAVLEHEVDVELDAVEVLLQEEIVARPEVDDVRGVELLPHQPVDAGERLERVDPDTPDLTVAELGLDDGGEPDLRGVRKQLVERLDAARLRRGQARALRCLAGAQLAARHIDRLDRIAG